MLKFSKPELHRPDRIWARIGTPPQYTSQYFVYHITDTKHSTNILLKVFKDGTVKLSCNSSFYLEDHSLTDFQNAITEAKELLKEIEE